MPPGAGQASGRMEDMQSWPEGGFGKNQTGGVTKSASGTLVFDGPSWNSLVMEDPDAYNP